MGRPFPAVDAQMVDNDDSDEMSKQLNRISLILNHSSNVPLFNYDIRKLPSYYCNRKKLKFHQKILIFQSTFFLIKN